MPDILSQEELDALLSNLDSDDEEEDEAPYIPPDPSPPRPERPVAAPPPGAPPSGDNLELILNLPLVVSVELGRTRMSILEMLQLGQGSIIELNRLSSDLIELTINGRRVARGEAVVVNENFGFRAVEVDSLKERIQKL
ncbi:FliM/FliN family flagellar motor switch protein [Myxococcota bacterium]|nr:FliM/FliN family flagellar motor switch protein [Myxococcota bacterium]MBU1431454.1 FliM/FliN family flagellar motor switch protein [Myxococcota bacterium]MBU1898554.1 FliM/FliN family flagellar motor switch protein [Myxococcota bacterium]